MKIQNLREKANKVIRDLSQILTWFLLRKLIIAFTRAIQEQKPNLSQAKTKTMIKGQVQHLNHRKEYSISLLETLSKWRLIVLLSSLLQQRLAQLHPILIKSIKTTGLPFLIFVDSSIVISSQSAMVMDNMEERSQHSLKIDFHNIQSTR